MFALGNRQTTRRKNHKSSEGRRRDQEVRAAYKKQLRIEPLEDRRLLSVFSVTNLSDGPVAQAGDLSGSLRQAIFDANANPGADTISFDSSLDGGTIALTAGELAITDSVTIQGPGAANLTIDAGGNSRIFDVNDNNSSNNINVEIDGLTLTGGNASGTGANGEGGAIFSYESLTVRDLTITGNTASGWGGGIAAVTTNGGTTTIQDSTISGNTAQAGGGGISASIGSNCTMTIQDSTISGNTASNDGGGIASSTATLGAATIQNSTIYGNSAGSYGGGIATETAWGTTTIQNSTIAGNVSDSDSDGIGAGGGIFVHGGTVLVQSTIVAGNTDNSGTAPDIGGGVTITNSLVGDNTGSGLAEVPVGTTDPSGNGNIVGDPTGQGTIDAGLNLLANNGGPTQTCALLPGSPAIDMGSNPAGLATDQRGAPFAREYGAATDMGAYEVNSLSLVVNTLADDNSGIYDPSNLSLREAVAMANTNPGLDTISFDPSLDGGTINLTNGELAITDSVIIQGPGASNLTIDAVNHSRIFDINDFDYSTNIYVEIDGLTLTGGNALGSNFWDGSGGAILSFDSLTVNDCTIEGNTAVYGGGGIAADTPAGATMTIQSTTVSGNTAGYGGGGIWAQSYSSMTLENSTISGNTTTNGGGGGVYARLIYGTMALESSVISGNTASSGSGGGVYAQVAYSSTATIQSSTVSGNSANIDGGGIWAHTYDDSQTTIEDSTISENTSNTTGGGIWTAIDATSTATVQGSTISGNTTNGAGGGIWAYTYFGSTTIQNSTITGNTAGGQGGGIYSFNWGTATLQNSTVTGNTSNGAGGGVNSHYASYPGSYGYSYTTFPLTVRSTIIARNTDQSGTAPDVSGQIDISNSLVGDNTGSGLTEVPVGTTDPSGLGNIVGEPASNGGQGVIDPMLGPLANNGGPTQTMALLPGSPAIDAGSNPTGLLYDQRGVGFLRDLGMQTDIGAYESPDTTPPVATLDPSSVVVAGSTATFTVTYADPDDNVLLSTIGGNNISVTAPDGSQQLASLVSVAPDGDGSPLVATYQISAPGGAWSVANTGNFAATMQAGQVSDSHNNFVVGGSLGTFDVEAWVPYAPTGYQASINTVQQDTTATISLNFDANHRVSDWGQVTWQGTTCTVDMKAEQWTGSLHGGPAPLAMQLDSHDYDLGNVAPGNYTFDLTSYGQAVGTTPFQVPTSVTIDRVVVAEANPQNGVLESNEQLLITWAVNGANTVGSKSLLVDGNAINTIYGPYGPNPDGSYYFAGVFGPMGVGTHQFTIHSADSKGNAGDYSGQFQVVAPSSTISISQVVVAEASAPKNGILDSTDSLVITWAVQGADKVGSRSLTVDGKAVSTIYGPYGPNPDGSYYFAGVFGPVAGGTHTYVIQSANSKGASAKYNGTFNVVSSGVSISDVVVAQAQSPTSGIIATGQPIVITWAITGPTSATTVATNSVLTVDGKPVSIKYGPYGPINGYTYDWAGVFGPLSAGTHNYVIQATDGHGHSARSTGSFKVSLAADLMVDASLPPQGSPTTVTDQQLAPIVAEAERRWAAADGSQVLATLAGVKVEVAQLTGGTLGETVGNTIVINRDAAGYGWFVDPTPSDDSEFADLLGAHTLAAEKGTVADQRVDLLTTVMHEMGHVLGLGDMGTGDLMSATLPLGTRRTISPLDQIGNGSSDNSSVDQLFAAIGK